MNKNQNINNAEDAFQHLQGKYNALALMHDATIIALVTMFPPNRRTEMSEVMINLLKEELTKPSEDNLHDQAFAEAINHGIKHIKNVANIAENS